MTTDAGIARARQLADEVANLICDLKDRLDESRDILSLHDFVIEIAKNLGPPVLAWCGHIGKELTPSAAPAAHAIRAQLEELFREAPAPIAGSSAAIPDVAIVLRSFPQPISGVLTKCASGLLKLGAMSPGDRNTPAGLIEHFFAYEEILAIVVRREVKAAAPVIFSSH